jgi:hypothetical protein
MVWSHNRSPASIKVILYEFKEWEQGHPNTFMTPEVTLFTVLYHIQDSRSSIYFATWVEDCLSAGFKYVGMTSIENLYEMVSIEISVYTDTYSACPPTGPLLP